MRHFEKELPEIGILDLRRLNDVLVKNHGTDLGIYAPASLKSKVSRFIADNSLKDIDSLIYALKNNSSCFPRLMNSISVGCSEFYRDPTFWRVLREEVFPVLNQNYPEINFWLPGCASGEEVLSLAITLYETGIYGKSKILTSDNHAKLPGKPSITEYCNTNYEVSDHNYRLYRTDDISNFSDYIIREHGKFVLKEFLYENIYYEVFNNQVPEKSLRFSNGFARTHMIICRNYFIYFTGQHQDKLLHVFTNALVSGGFLAIGNMENISFCEDFSRYTAFNAYERIYRKK